MIDPRTPVLVGVAQYVDRDLAPDTALSPLDMLARTGVAALADSGGSGIVVDTLAVVRLFADSSPAFRAPFGAYTNLPKSLANRLGQSPARQNYGPVGGNTPQMFVNMFAEAIRTGAADVALVAGCEALRTQAKGAEGRGWRSIGRMTPAAYRRRSARRRGSSRATRSPTASPCRSTSTRCSRTPWPRTTATSPSRTAGASAR